MKTYSMKHYRKLLKRSKELINLSSEFHFVALLYLLIYHAGLIKHLSIKRQHREIDLKLDARQLSNWLSSFDLKLSRPFLNLLTTRYLTNIKRYRNLLKKNVANHELSHHKFTLNLLFTPEEIVLDISIFRNIGIDDESLIDFHTTLNVIEFPAIN